MIMQTPVIKKMITTLSILLLNSLFTVNSLAVVIHDELGSSGITTGDLSGNLAAPTSLSFGIGANTIIGQIGANGNNGATNGNDADYFTFSLSSGVSIDSIVIDSHSGTGPSFLGYRAGTSFSGQAIGDIDNFVLFQSTSGDILPSLAGGSLGAGDYAFWIQETAAGPVNYQITFNTVPEPSTALLTFLGMGLFLLRRPRKCTLS